MKRIFVFFAIFFLTLGIAHASTGERIAEKLKEVVLSPEMVVIIISMLPVVELRGALPVGINLFKMPIWETVLLAIIGNMIPIFFVVFFLEKIVKLLSRFSIFKRFFDWIFARTRSKSGSIEKFEFWGLAIFVGIPLPGTGAWTGAIASVAMAMPYWRSLLSIFIGVLIAGAIVTLLCYLGYWGLVIAGAALLIFIVQGILSYYKSRAATQ